MTYAIVADVEVLLAREVEPEVAAMIERRLAQVERLIIKRIPDLAARAAASASYLDDLVDIEAEAVARVARNPEGYLSETDGPYSYQRTSTGDTALHLTDDEWNVLGVAPRRGMFTISPGL